MGEEDANATGPQGLDKSWWERNKKMGKGRSLSDKVGITPDKENKAWLYIDI